MKRPVKLMTLFAPAALAVALGCADHSGNPDRADGGRNGHRRGDADADNDADADTDADSDADTESGTRPSSR